MNDKYCGSGLRADNITYILCARVCAVSVKVSKKKKEHARERRYLTLSVYVRFSSNAIFTLFFSSHDI